MPLLVRWYPEVPCQPEPAHHPHLYICSDPDDDCHDDLEDGKGFMEFHELQCCVDGQKWPCETKKEHTEAKRKAKK